VRVNRREQFVSWMFRSRREAHRVRDGFVAYLIVVAQGFFWAGVTDIRHLAWWRQLGIIAIFSVLPYLVLWGILREKEEKRQREDMETHGIEPSTAADHWRSLALNQAEVVLGQSSPADFETTQNAASMCVAVVSNLEGAEAWRASYDSLDSFYAAYEARHPDIRLYAAVWDEIHDPNDPPHGTGALIAQRIAARRAQSG
jgi:hypothetical protein